MIENITLQSVCNCIVLAGAVIIAIKNIYNFFKKPVKDLQNKARTDEEKHIEEVINERVPVLLMEYNNSIKNERLSEHEKMSISIKQTLADIFNKRFEELKNIALQYEGEIQNIQTSINLLNKTSLDLMRYNMNKIYYKYRPYKKILSSDKKAFIQMYNDYKPMGGNNWIDALHDELITWEIIEDEEELKADI